MSNAIAASSLAIGPGRPKAWPGMAGERGDPHSRRLELIEQPADDLTVRNIGMGRSCC